MKRVLNIGCGPNYPGALHPAFQGDDWDEIRVDIDPDVEPDVWASMTDLPPEWTGTADAVWTAHTLEHLPAHDVPVALGECLRVLRPGGALFMVVPDLQLAATFSALGRAEDVVYTSLSGPITAMDMVFGHRDMLAAGRTYMGHQTGFTAMTLTVALTVAGFARVNVVSDGHNLIATAYAPGVWGEV